jgi:hypothetical protein
VRKVIATNVIGSQAQQQLALAKPTFEEYAERFGYDLVIGDRHAPGRTPHWGKIILLQELVQEYDLVLWLDSDAMILNFTMDIAQMLDEDCFQALLMEQHGVRWNPNTGVWLLRGKDQTTIQFLQDVWETGPQPGPWNEQSAVIKTMGWGIMPFPKGCKIIEATPYTAKTSWLAPEWNRIPELYPHVNPIINHWAGGPNAVERRISEMTDILQRLRDAGLQR